MSERLKEIQVLLDHLSDEANLLHQAKLRRQIQKMFKEQEERVEELEKLLGFMEKQRIEMGNSHGETIKGAGMLLEINQRYKQALETISEHATDDLDNYVTRYLDFKYIARQALKGESQ